MDMRLGTLDIAAIGDGSLLAPAVRAAAASLSPDDVGVVAIDAAFSDTAAFCERYGVGQGQAANCVILEASRGDRTWLLACVVLGSTRADVNGLVRRTVDARRVSFAPMERAVAETGMEHGAITPLGLPEGWPVLVDRAVAEAGLVVVGSGRRGSKLVVVGSALAALPGAQVLDGLAKAAPQP